MRGLRDDLARRRVMYRYNPAYAGTTSSCFLMRRQCLIQPRVCGDYSRALNKSIIHADTTPRMRGLHHSGCQLVSRIRYNPAYAGTTRTNHEGISNLTIQPRVCGDYRQHCYMPSSRRDTTPRMRGLPICKNKVTTTSRYNPAYAGTTHNSWFVLGISSIQPRVCGDYTVANVAAATGLDTTPRMRGLQ